MHRNDDDDNEDVEYVDAMDTIEDDVLQFKGKMYIKDDEMYSVNNSSSFFSIYARFRLINVHISLIYIKMIFLIFHVLISLNFL